MTQGLTKLSGSVPPFASHRTPAGAESREVGRGWSPTIRMRNSGSAVKPAAPHRTTRWAPQWPDVSSFVTKPRRDITVRRVPLHGREAGDATVEGTPAERLALVRTLSLTAWAVTGNRCLSTLERTCPSEGSGSEPIAIATDGDVAFRLAFSLPRPEATSAIGDPRLAPRGS